MEKEKFPDELKCSICEEIMEKVMIGIGDYTYKCRNKYCETYEMN